MDHDGSQVQPLQRRASYNEGDRSGYEGPTIGYNNTQSLGLSTPPLQGLGPHMGGPYPMAAPP